MKSTKSWFHY